MDACLYETLYLGRLSIIYIWDFIKINANITYWTKLLSLFSEQSALCPGCKNVSLLDCTLFHTHWRKAVSNTLSRITSSFNPAFLNWSATMILNWPTKYKPYNNIMIPVTEIYQSSISLKNEPDQDDFIRFCSRFQPNHNSMRLD